MVISDLDVNVQQSLESFLQMVQDLQNVPTMMKCQPTELPAILYKNTSGLKIFARSMLYKECLNTFGDFELLLSHGTLNHVYNSDEGIEGAIQQLNSSASQYIGLLVKILCLNRGRQRRQLINYIPKMLATEVESFTIESTVLQKYEHLHGMYDWQHKQRITTLLWIMEMGFEMNLYAIYEYPMIFM